MPVRPIPPEWQHLPPDVVGSFDMLGAVPIPNHGVINPLPASASHASRGRSRKKKKSGSKASSESKASKSNMESSQSGFSKRKKKSHEAKDQGASTQQEKTPFYRVPFLGGGTVWDFMTTFEHHNAYNSGSEMASSLAQSGGYPQGSGYY